LWLLGGISSLEGDPPTPRADFEVAVVGPATSAALAVVLYLVAVLLAVADVADIVVAALVWLATINGVLAVFNMLPGAPLDGGRVLRALLWKRSGDWRRSAVRAARAGRVVGWLMVVGGAAELLATGTIGGAWLMLIGWFVVDAAQGEEMQTILVSSLRGVLVGDVMTARPVVAPAGISVNDLLHDYVLRHRCSSFPLVDDAGRVESLVTLSAIKRVPVAQRATTPAGAVGWPLELLTRAEPAEPLLAVLRRASGVADGRILVFEGEELVGIVSPSDVARTLQHRDVALDHERRAA
jgi:CBS domain-containing protein